MPLQGLWKPSRRNVEGVEETAVKNARWIYLNHRSGVRLAELPVLFGVSSALILHNERSLAGLHNNATQSSAGHARLGS